MNKSSFSRWKELVRKMDRWRKTKLPLPSLNGMSRRAVVFGTIASIAITGPAAARAMHGGTAAAGGGGGATLTTMVLKTKSGSNIAANQIFEFGLPIAPATMSTSQKVTCRDASSSALAVQEDNRIVDADGYVRWVFVTSVLVNAPGAATTNITVGITAGAPDTSNPISVANMLAQTKSGDTFEFKGEMALDVAGTAYQVKATDLLNALSTWTYGSPLFIGYHRQGPLCTEVCVYGPFTAVSGAAAHPYLYRECHIAAYKTSNAAWNNATNPITGIRVFRFDENGFNGNVAGWSSTPQDYVYDIVDKVGASTLATVLSLTGAATTGNLTVPTPGVTTNTFDGSISGTVLTVTAYTSGDQNIGIGQELQGAGIPANTRIISLGTGTGRTGTYNLSASLTIGSQSNTTRPLYGNDFALVRAAGTFALSTSAPNSSDSGKAIVELSGAGTGRAYIGECANGATTAYCAVPNATVFSNPTVTSWKTLGVYHYFGSRVSNTLPTIGGAWWGTNSDLVYPILTSAYLMASQMLPNLRSTRTNTPVPSLTAINRDGAHPCGMSMHNGQMKGYGLNESSTGDASHIGVMSYEQCQALVWWDDATQHANARTSIIANADVGHRKPYVYRNEDYGMFNSLADNGVYGLSTDVPFQLNITRAGSNWFTFAGNHSGQTDWMPYIVTGNLYHLQNMYLLGISYSQSMNNYGLIDQATLIGGANTNVTCSGTTITGTHTTLGFQTGDSFSFYGGRPSVGGVQIQPNNRYFYRQLTTNTGQAYDTLANCLSGGSTGRVTFSSGGAGVFLVNGYWKQAVSRNGEGQLRQITWNRRSVGQPAALAPTSPITPGSCVAPGWSRTNAIRALTNFLGWASTLYVTNANYLPGFKPRFFTISNGTAGGLWQMGYSRETDLNLLEAGVLSPTSSVLQAQLDWSLADAIQWHVEPTIWPPAYCSNYYFQFVSNFVGSALPATTYDFIDMYNTGAGTPWDQTAYMRCYQSVMTATVGSVADPTNVPITLSANYFDITNKTPYELTAWFGTTSGPRGGLSGYGRIKSIISATQIVVDFTITSAWGRTITPIVPTPGAGQNICLPLPPAGVAAANATHADYYYDGNNYYGTVNADIAQLDRACLEIGKQRSINQGNYSAAVAEMTGRNFAFAATNASPGEVKFAWLSRI